MPVSHSSGLNVLFPLFLRCAFPPSTNLSLVLPSLVCLIPPQSCICCLQRMYLLGLITFAFLQQVRVNGGKQRRVFEYFASLGLLFHLYMAGLRPLLSPCHTCIPHTRSAFFFLMDSGFASPAPKSLGISPPISMRQNPNCFCDKR